MTKTDKLMDVIINHRCLTTKDPACNSFTRLLNDYGIYGNDVLKFCERLADINRRFNNG